MPNYAGLAKKKQELVRKALDGSLFTAPADAPAIASLTTYTAATTTAPEVIELTPLPAGYVDGGLTTDEGLRFARAVETSETTSWGRVEPTRSDTNSDVTTLAVDFQELSKFTLSLYTGAALASLVPVADSKELRIPKPARPTARYYRLLALAVDDTDAGEIYVAKFFPRAKTTEFSDQAFAKGDDAINWGMTFTAYVDDALGYSQNDMFGGPGWKALITEMGF
jgi:hypothetical protein